MFIKECNIRNILTYDACLGFELYRFYLNGGIDAENTLKYLQRTVAHQIYQKYSYMGIDILEDLYQACSLQLWLSIFHKRLPREEIGKFHQYIYEVVRRWIGFTFDKEYDDSHKYLDISNWDQSNLRRFRFQYDIDNDIFLDELPQSITWDLMDFCRFKGNTRRAIRYCIGCILTGSRIATSYLKRRYDLIDPDFIIEHTLIILRSCLYRYKKLLGSRPSKECVVFVADEEGMYASVYPEERED
jgi:hypothetical protein